MAKNVDDVKPVAGYGDDWLGMSDALDFDGGEGDEEFELENSDAIADAAMDVFDDISVSDEDAASVQMSDAPAAADVFDNLSISYEETASAADDSAPEEEYVSPGLRDDFDNEEDTKDIPASASDAVAEKSTDKPTQEKTTQEKPKKERRKPLGVVEGSAVTTQLLDISTLQKKVEEQIRKSARPSWEEDPLKKDAQLWQFVSLITIRLFDDLELFVLQKRCDEACDLMKQLSRLGNILCFAGMGELLPLIAYMSNLLPVSFTEMPIGKAGVRKFDALKMGAFMDRSNEFLNCLVYLLTYVSKHADAFDTRRFSGNLETLYDSLEASPGHPSIEAPLPIDDGVNPVELTTRTVNKLARTLEALVTESLHYVESGAFYGYSNGYEDASRSLDNAAQVAREYGLEALQTVFGRLCDALRVLVPPMVPQASAYEDYFQVCNLLESHFSKSIMEKKIKHLRMLVSKFRDESSKEHEAEIIAKASFTSRWRMFVNASSPLLEHISNRGLKDRLAAVKTQAEKTEIPWLCDTFKKLDDLWTTYPESAAQAFVCLVDELRAFPMDGIAEEDIEHLNHERLQVLFARKPDAKPLSAYTVIRNALKFAEELEGYKDTLSMVSTSKVQDLLIDARMIHCHALARVCEMMLSLLEKVPSAGSIADTLLDSILVTAKLMQNVCIYIEQHLDHDPTSTVVSSKQILYSSLMAFYTPKGRPRDGIVHYIKKRMSALLAEIQLAWDGMPVSGEYYGNLIRRLLHLVTVCGMNSSRTALSEHLNTISKQGMAYNDAEMQRQCGRMLRSVEEEISAQSNTDGESQIRTFFKKIIAALNQLLSSADINDSETLSTELARIEGQIGILGKSTDFPPVLAAIHDLHNLVFDENVSKNHVETLLYHILNMASHLCPDWNDPDQGELEFIKTPMPIPMPLFQRMLDAVKSVYLAFGKYAANEPIAWEQMGWLNHNFSQLVANLPSILRNIAQNLQNRCQYLKKNIYIGVNLEGYSGESDDGEYIVRPAISAAFSTVLERLLELITDYAFDRTDSSSRIDIVLQPNQHELAVLVRHTGKRLTHDEIRRKLATVNILDTNDENIFGLMVGSDTLFETYPPAVGFSYIIAVLKQFDGTLSIADINGATSFALKFRL